MKSTIIAAIALLLRFQSLTAAEPASIITELGEYRLNPKTTLLVFADQQRMVKYSLTTTVKTGTRGTTSSLQITSERPFQFHWDQSTSRLWWATSSTMGFLDASDPSNTKSAVYNRPAITELPAVPTAFREAVIKAQ